MLPLELPLAPDIGDTLVAASPAMLEAVRQLALYAVAQTPLILVGATGTGKTFCARLAHEWSGRHGDFVAVSAGELNSPLAASELFGHVRGAFTGAAGSRSGYFASARGGTLLLDDFQNLGLSRQKMLLGVLEDQRYRPVGSDRSVALGCRVVIGVDDDPDALVATRRLHPHLRYRFAYNAVRLPPLNERRDEIPAFAQRFLEECPARTGVAEGPRVIAREALATLVMADYPGNVRQLRGMIEAGYLLARGEAELRPAHLPGSARSVVRYDRRATRAENLRAMAAALAATGGRIEPAARLIGAGRTTGFRLKRELEWSGRA